MRHYLISSYLTLGPEQPCQADTCGVRGRTSRNITCMDTHSNDVISLNDNIISLFD